jgi:hypothetical protein
MDLSAKWDITAWTPFAYLAACGVAITVLGLLSMPFGWVGRGFLFALVGGMIATVGGYLHCTKDANHVLTLSAGIDPWPVLTSYIGVVAAGVMFLAIGLFVSSLVKGQMIAALISITLGVPLLLPVLFMAKMDPSGWMYRIAAFITVPHHFGKDFTRGVLDTRHLVFYLSTGFLFLFLTVRSVESQRR